MVGSVSLTIKALCDMLIEHSGLQVMLGTPNDPLLDASAVLWIWALQESSTFNYNPSAEAPASPTQDVYFMLLVNPNLSFEQIDQLERLRLAMIENPVLCVAEKRVQVLLNPLTTNELSDLFLAAQTPLRVGISALIRGV
jgi:hypothetical protein